MRLPQLLKSYPDCYQLQVIIYNLQFFDNPKETKELNVLFKFHACAPE